MLLQSLEIIVGVIFFFFTIQVVFALIVFITGIVLIKSYDNYILNPPIEESLPTLGPKPNSTLKKSMILNLPWLILNLLGIIISFFINFEILLFNVYFLNILELLIIIGNIIIGTFFFMYLYERDLKVSLIPILAIQVILYGVMSFLKLFLVVSVASFIIIMIFEEMTIIYLSYLIGLLIITSLTTFFVYWGNKIQLIKWVKFIIPIAIIPGLFSLSLIYSINPFDFFDNTAIYVIISLIISMVVATIIKKLSYRTIPFKQLEEMIPLEKDVILLEAKDLKIHYPLLTGVLKKQIGAVRAVDGVSFRIKSGETVGLVGESGCGKTTIAMAILGLVDKNGGELLLKNQPLPSDYSSKIRKTIQMVFQDPDASLNPQLKVVDNIAEPLRNILGITNKEIIRRRVLRLLEEVSLKREHMDRYPHEFSGGQKQRITIARALACNPEIIILDEPTSALDVSVQAQILNLLKDLQKTYNYGFLFITHDLSVVNHIADRVAVMYLGKFVEVGDKEQIFSNPTHPYTKALLASRSEVSAEDQEITFVLSGEVPSPIAPPPGCNFHPRCYTESYNDLCKRDTPHKIQVEEGHYIWCVNEEVLKDTHEFVF